MSQVEIARMQTVLARQRASFTAAMPEAMSVRRDRIDRAISLLVEHKDAFAKELKAARKFDDVKTCLMEAERVAQRWEKDYPRAAQQIREQFEETLAVHDLPPEHRRRVYTTNIMERLMKEIKRRTRVVGIFPNEASCDRLVGAHLLERDETWQCERMRYLVMEHLEEPVPQTKTAKRTAA